MPFSIVIKPIVWLDIEDAIDWYEKQSPRLGKRFYKNFEEATERILSQPTVYITVTQNVRRVLLKTFPYKLFYTISGDTIYILGLLHGKRSKASIKKRLQLK